MPNYNYLNIFKQIILYKGVPLTPPPPPTLHLPYWRFIKVEFLTLYTFIINIFNVLLK